MRLVSKSPAAAAAFRVFLRVRVVVLLLHAALAHGAVGASSPVYDPTGSPWNSAILGWQVGLSGFETAQVRGGTELFFGTVPFPESNVNTTWQVLRWDHEAGAMRQVFVSHRNYESPNLIELIRLVDIDGDGRTEVMVVRWNGLAEFFSRETKELLASIQLTPDVFRDAAMADVNRDGHKELLILTSSSTLIVDGLQSFPRGRVSVSRLDGAGAVRFFVGQLDDDPPLEILYTRGAVIEVGSWKVEWDVAEYSPDVLVRGLIDRDGDGISELLMTRDDRVVTLDLKSRAEVWGATVEPRLVAFDLQLLQFDTDAAPELVLGGREIIVVDSLTGATEARFPVVRTPGKARELLSIADVDGDGSFEAIYAEGDRHHQEDMVITRLSDSSVLWRTDNAQFYRDRALLGDVDGDERLDLVIGGTWEVTLVDPHSSERKGRLTGLQGFELMEVKDVDGDARCEILLAEIDDGGQREVRVYTYKEGRFSLLWSKAIQDPIHSHGRNRYVALAVADWDGDGTSEIIGGWSIDDTLWSGTVAAGVDIYRVSDGKVVWSSPRQYGELTSMAVGNFDRDPELEIAGIFGGKWLRVWEPAAAKQEFKLRGDFTALATLPTGFAAGHKSGQVSRFSAGKRGRLARTSVQSGAAGPVLGITPDLDGRSLWLATEKQYRWLPPKGQDGFGIARDIFDHNRKVALYAGSEGNWLFGTFSTVVRGFPLWR